MNVSNGNGSLQQDTKNKNCAVGNESNGDVGKELDKKCYG